MVRLKVICQRLFLPLFTLAVLFAFHPTASAAVNPVRFLSSIHALQLGASADCNNNGRPDLQEGSWANRDDDGDGVCNGVDNCPYEVNPTQDPSVCAMQAITVPWIPNDPTQPHLTYSGATTTLKGVARYGGDQYMWDYGDGTTPMAWTDIANPYNLGVNHVYVGAAGRYFTATLSIRSHTNPAVVSSATYPLLIMQSVDLGDTQQFSVRAQMAIDQALWFLHINQARSTFPDIPPGYAQRYGYWADNSDVITTACLAADAFENHGTRQENHSDPYAEDVERTFNYVLEQLQASSISPTANGNPDTNGNGLGISTIANQGVGEFPSVCLSALAHANSPNRVAAAGANNIFGRTYKDIAQDMVDEIAFWQISISNAYRGGWSYTPGDDVIYQETAPWQVYGMADAESKMGVTVPTFVRQYLPYWLAADSNTESDIYNGSYNFFGVYQPNFINIYNAAGGAFEQAFLGNPVVYPRNEQSIGFIYRFWNYSDGGWVTNLGNPDSMYAVARAMTYFSPALTRINDYDYNNHVQSSNSFDWYYTPTGQSQQGIASFLVAHQGADGSLRETQGYESRTNDPATAMNVATLMSRKDGKILAKIGRYASVTDAADITAPEWASLVQVDGAELTGIGCIDAHSDCILGTYLWAKGETHSLTAAQSQTDSAGTTLFHFLGWSDGLSDLTRDIKVCGPTSDANACPDLTYLTVTANYGERFSLQTAVSPAHGGTVQVGTAPQSDGFYDAGTVVSITAVPAPGYKFQNWNGRVDDPNSPTTTVSMGVPASVTATFAAVADSTPPIISVPGPITTEATSASGAAVSYSATATDNVDGTVPVTCSFASGAVFPLGITSVSCVASDAANNTASASFTVRVIDTTAPSLTLPANIITTAAASIGTVVNYNTSAMDTVSGAIAPSCAPASGSTFPIGTTAVNCSAVDAAGNSRNGSFTVTVNMPSTTIGMNLTSKTGTASSRLWTMTVANVGSGPALGTYITSLTLTQTYGAACRPVIVTPLPALVGDIAAGTQGATAIQIDFTGCTSLSRFTVNSSASANGGTSNATLSRTNQYQ